MRQQARWVILFLVFIVSAMFFVRMVRPHARAPQPPPEHHSLLVTPARAMPASLASVTEPEPPIDLTAPQCQPVAAECDESAGAGASPQSQPTVPSVPASAPATERRTEAQAEAEPQNETNVPTAEPALPLIHLMEGYPGPAFRPLEPPPSYEDPVGLGVGTGTVREGIGVDPLPGERNPLGTGQSHLGIR